MQKKLEKTFKELFNQKNCFYMVSGTDAFLISLELMKVKENDEIIFPISICESLIYRATQLFGIIPVVVDVDENLNLAYEDIKNNITSKTKVIIDWHPFGYAQNIDLMKLLGSQLKEQIYIIEDCAQALGCTINGNFVGNVGDISIFSFGKNKPIDCGRGGMISINNSSLINYDILFKHQNKIIKEDFLLINKKIENYKSIINIKQNNVIAFCNEIEQNKILEKHDDFKTNNVYNRFIARSTTYNDYSRLLKLEKYLKMNNISIFQPLYNMDEFFKNYLNYYYVKNNRKDLIFDTRRYSKWETFKNSYMLFRTDTSVDMHMIKSTIRCINKFYEV